MPTLADALREPIPLSPNRPPRFYRGGRLIEAFRGRPDADDDDRPEDWVGSATRTWTPPGRPPSDAGPSRVEVGGMRLGLDEVLARDPEALVGRPWLEAAGPTLGVLVKLLDAAVRLPVHAHPTRDAARRLLGSPFGKTEAWIVLGTRDGPGAPRVWAGFRESVGRDDLRGWIERQQTDSLLGALVEHEVAAGDAFLIPGGTPHAIGAGVFLLELQEPTDFSVVAETRGFPISAEDASLGLGWDRAIEFFTTEAAGGLRREPWPERDGMRDLLGPDAAPYFRAVALRVHASRGWPVPATFAVGVVLAGGGALVGRRTVLPLARGTTFALPAAAASEAELRGTELELVVCLPPDPGSLARDPL